MDTTAISTITSKGQVTIPQTIRDAAHLKPGDRITWRISEDGLLQVTRARRGRLQDLFGMLHRPGMKAATLEEIDEGIAQYMREKHGRKSEDAL